MRSRQASLLVQRILHLRQVQSQLQSAPLVLRRGLAASSGDDDNDSKPGLMQKIWGLSRKAEKAGKEVAAAEASAASDAADGSDGSSTVPEAGASDSSNSERALVLSGPERKHHKVFVVELTRKPLFPGIYTPVTISKNEKLIKEIMDTKKQGAQAYVGAFLRMPDPPPASTASTAATTSGLTLDLTDPAGSSSSSSGGEGLASDISPEPGGSGSSGGGGSSPLDELGVLRSPRAAAGGRQGLRGRGKPGAGGVAGAAGDADAANHLYEMGTFAQVHTLLTGDTSDSAQLLLLGHRRIRRKAVISAEPLKVHIEHLKDEAYTNNDILKATSMELVNTMRDLLHLNPLYGEQFRTLLSLTGSLDLQDMSRLVDAAASLTSADDTTLQTLVLQQLNVPERAQAVLVLLKKEVELCKLQADIREQVENKVVKEQRRALLMEQLKSIKRELGLEKDDKAALVQKFQERWDAKKGLAPEEAVRVVAEELEKLGSLEPVSSEFNVTRTYLDWLTCLPWGTHSPDLFDLSHAQQVLDEDHYGLEDVKERILEFIAVSGLRGSAQGKILCLVGPPGVGKTSVGRSIARTLARKYYRFSVGGLHDVAEIKGHRRTYVGAMPGKMVQCLKTTQTSNPLVLIDEIDKLGRGGYQGDPASALLELLDPEQNTGFMDHYLDIPVDLSKVLFVCTANVLDTIPGPLLDRMEVIRLSGYAAGEKEAIARKYLEPQAAETSGVPPGAVQLTDQAMNVLINDYCREAGVRNLKKQLEKIYRKVALKLFKDGSVTNTPSASPSAPAAAAASPPPPSSHPSPDAAPPAPPAPSPDPTSPPCLDSTLTATAADLTPSAPSPSPAAVPEAAPGHDQPAPSQASEALPPHLGAAASPTPHTPNSSSSSSSSSEGGTQQAAAPHRYTGSPIIINADALKDYVGQPPFAQDKFYEVTPPGVVMGLAWTSMGGATLYVEAARVHEGEAKGSLVTTGQLGDVFRESATIAHTFARTYLAGLQPGSTFFKSSAIHIHVPHGSTPKDGPSAGCTLITALLSLALGRRVAPDLAMTGEVTLTGRVLPIGGVKEKVLAARRAGVKQVLFPEGNRPDYDELSADLKEGLTPHFVSTYDQVFKLALQYEGVLTEASNTPSPSPSPSPSPPSLDPAAPLTPPSGVQIAS